MIVIVLTGLAILPLLIITFGGLFLRKILQKSTIPWALALAFLALGSELTYFYLQASESIAMKQWMVVSNLMAIFPLYATLSVVSIVLLGIVFLEFKRLTLVRVATIGIFAIAAFNVRTMTFQKSFAEFRMNQTLSTASMNENEMLNVLNSNDDKMKEKILIASRSDLTPPVIQRLAEDSKEILRFYAVQSPLISNEKLEQLLANDESKEIRKQAKIELKKRGLRQ